MDVEGDPDLQLEVAKIFERIVLVIWLVVGQTPLKNMSSSIGMMTFQIYGKIIQSCSRKTTNQNQYKPNKIP